jgi:hypothetical protein
MEKKEVLGLVIIANCQFGEIFVLRGYLTRREPGGALLIRRGLFGSHN